MAALENEVLRNPKPSLVDRSVLELSADKLVPPDIYVDRAVLRGRMGYDDVYEAGGPLRGHKSHWSESPDSDMELVAEAKARIQELQKEAETLEEAYRNYQQRAVRSTISHMLPPRPLSPQQAHHSHWPDSPLRKQVSHHSTHKQKVNHRPLSPQTTRTPSSTSYDTRNTLPPAQPRVTFSEDRNQPQTSGLFTDHLHSVAEPLFARDGHPLEESSPPSRRLSSTLHSPSRKKLQSEIAEGTFKECFILSKHFKVLDAAASFDCQEIHNEMVSSCQCSNTAHLTHVLLMFHNIQNSQSISFWQSNNNNNNSLSSIRILLNIKFLPLLEAVVSLMASPELSSDRQLLRGPQDEVATSGDVSSELSPPCSPQLKSTARDPPRYHLALLRQRQDNTFMIFFFLQTDSEY